MQQCRQFIQTNYQRLASLANVQTAWATCTSTYACNSWLVNSLKKSNVFIYQFYEIECTCRLRLAQVMFITYFFLFILI